MIRLNSQLLSCAHLDRSPPIASSAQLRLRLTTLKLISSSSFSTLISKLSLIVEEVIESTLPPLGIILIIVSGLIQLVSFDHRISRSFSILTGKAARNGSRDRKCSGSTLPFPIISGSRKSPFSEFQYKHKTFKHDQNILNLSWYPRWATKYQPTSPFFKLNQIPRVLISWSILSGLWIKPNSLVANINVDN